VWFLDHLRDFCMASAINLTDIQTLMFK